VTVIADRPNTRMIPALLSEADDDETVVIRLDEEDAAVVLSPAQYQRFRRIAAAEEFRQLSERVGRQAQENGLTQEILDEFLAETKADCTA
jgi:L-amino acid N-acyltransferase YncA